MKDAIVLSYLERGQTPPVDVDVSKMTMWRIKNNYWGDNEKLVLKRVVDRQSWTRYLNEHDIRNAITLAVLLKRYDQPYQDMPDWRIAPEAHINIDTTSIQFGYSNSDKQKIYITPDMEKKFRSKGWNLKFLDEEKKPSAFGMRLLTAITAGGQALPPVAIFKVQQLDSTDVRVWAVKDFGRSGVGYVVAVSSFHTDAMKKVYDWYFDSVLLKYIGDKTADLKDRYPADDLRSKLAERFLVTLDGEMVQLNSILDPVLLKEFAARNIGVVKLMAGCSASFQPSDVALCYKLLKRYIRTKKFEQFTQPGVQRSLDAIKLSLRRDPSSSKWRNAFIHQVYRGVIAIASCIHNAFSPHHIMKGFSDIGYYPLDERKLLSRTKGIASARVEHALRVLPLLCEQSK